MRLAVQRSPQLGLAIPAAVAGLGVALGGAQLALVVLGAGLALCVYTGILLLGLRDWRLLVYGLLLYLPLSGVATVLLYPFASPGIATLIKDVVFIIPAYVGFFLGRILRREPCLFPGAPVVLVGCFTWWLVLQSINYSYSQQNLWVPVIGLKVWLFYLPLACLGYYFVSDRHDLRRLSKLMLLSGVIPVVIGLSQVALIKSGYADLAFAPYGALARSATQGFHQTVYESGGALPRVPSTFNSWANYALFAATIVAVGYAYLRSSQHPNRVLIGVWLVVVLGALLSGSHGAFLMVPLLLLIIAVLEGRLRQVLLGSLSLAVLVGAAGALVGAQPAELVRLALGAAGQYVGDTFVVGVQDALGLTFWGLGTGVNTSGIRWVLATSPAAEIYGYGAESWFAKVILELGVPGLLVMILLLGTVVFQAGWRLRRLKTGWAKSAAAALLGLWIWNLIYLTKLQTIDLDPMNVYFWFLGGVLFRALDLGERELERAPGEASDAASGESQGGRSKARARIGVEPGHA